MVIYMKITMVSNYINHHQIPFSSAIYDRIGDEYHFVQTEEMEQKRIDMGWAVNSKSLPYVVLSYDEYDKAKKAIDDSDLLIVGWIKDESIIYDRLNNGKPVFRISERLYREGQWKVISPKGLIRKYKDHIRYRNKPVYLLCNGAYVASDFNLIHAYPDKKYKFGYFPKTRNYYDPSILYRKKGELKKVEIEYADELPAPLPTLTNREIKIIWAGRFLELKHPEYMIKLARDLQFRGYRFHIDMIGSGPMDDELKASAEYELVSEYITFHGFLDPAKVRDMMEYCHIHIFTSNFLEGWGAVVNEGMNAGCAEIVNDETGVGPFLINHGVNGLLYSKGNYESMLEQVLMLFENPELIGQFGKKAYETITQEWNAETAVERIFEFYDGLVNGKKISYDDGPMSIAKVINPGFFVSGKLDD